MLRPKACSTTFPAVGRADYHSADWFATKPETFTAPRRTTAVQTTARVLAAVWFSSFLPRAMGGLNLCCIVSPGNGTEPSLTRACPLIRQEIFTAPPFMEAIS